MLHATIRTFPSMNSNRKAASDASLKPRSVQCRWMLSSSLAAACHVLLGPNVVHLGHAWLTRRGAGCADLPETNSRAENPRGEPVLAVQAAQPPKKKTVHKSAETKPGWPPPGRGADAPVLGVFAALRCLDGAWQEPKLVKFLQKERPLGISGLR